MLVIIYITLSTDMISHLIIDYMTVIYTEPELYKFDNIYRSSK